METSCTLILNSFQAEQLASLCAAYRAYAWQRLPPSPERNQIMRAAQVVQGRLAGMQTIGAEALSLLLSEEVRQALRAVMNTLMQAYGAEVPSAERDRQLESLYVLRVLIERVGRQTMAS